jgi:branched-chain amino acid aminotransferase
VNASAATWVWVDGRLSVAEEAWVAALDHGVTVGDGVFETCKVVDGTPFALGRHLRRLRRSAGIMGLTVPADDAELREITAKAIAAAGDDGTVVGRLRITLTGGPGPLGSGRDTVPGTLLVAAGAGDAWASTTDVVTVDWTRNERSAIAGAKTTSYAENVVALARARDQGATEAILANTTGALCEGTGTNVFLVAGGRLCTPSLATGCLAGITRELVLEAVEVDERDDLTLDDLRSAPEAFLTSSTRDVQPIAHVDGMALAAAPGPFTTAARDGFRATEAGSLDP